MATAASHSASNPFAHDVVRSLSELCNHASSLLAQRLLSLAHPEGDAQTAFLASLGLAGPSLGQSSAAGSTTPESGSCCADPVMRLLPLAAPQPESHQQHLDDGHLWASPGLAYLPWSHEEPPSTSTSPSLPDSAAALAASPSHHHLSSPPRPSAPVPAQHQPALALALPRLPDLHAVLESRLAGLLFFWHAAVSLQQRVLVTALWHMAHAAGAAERARRAIPPVHAVPELVHWAAASAAARAEESLALALARTAGAASAAAAGVPAAAAAVTGSAAATATVAAASAPHLPLLRVARRRLLGAALPLLEQLRGVQRGCTTHVLLRFVLFSSLNPRLRRDLLVNLDVLSRRATQLALLQEQHDAWVTRQPPPPGSSYHPAPSAAGSGSPAPAPAARSPPHRQLHPLQPAAAPQAGGNGGDPAAAVAALSARWYRSVFAPEMQACGRQLSCGAPAAPPDDAAAGDPPGRFDLRDLYRLIRVLEVAVEDLERYC